MRAVGSYLFAAELRKTKVSDLSWTWDQLSQAWYVRRACDGLMLAYITVESVCYVVFTAESTISNWIWRVCNRCIDGPEDSEPDLVLKDPK